MKILFLTTDLKNFGGIQQYNRQLLRVLSEQNENVFVLERKSGFWGKMKFTVGVFFYAWRDRPDVIFCGHINFSPLALVLFKLKNQRFVVFVHGVDAWDIHGTWRRVALEKAEKVVTVSWYTAEKVIHQLPGVKERFFIIPNSVDGKKFFIKEKPRYLFERHGISDTKIILTVSRLSKVEAGFKGYDRVIESLPRISAAVPNVKYVLVGGGDDMPRIRELVKNLKLETQVILAGKVGGEELIDYYNLADVFVMPSKCEGFGIVFLEALACGLPVIAGNRDASPETLLQGKLGFLVDPDNKEEIADAVVGVLNKKSSSRLLDREHLRWETLKHYGREKFDERVKLFLHENLRK
ncbi:MAG: glycosyltransferase family 4 protein [Candidatus Brennerbacteria bacterium]|nr:glycosyltransferase family 4 protein [Candidatus Brennerbacteria bacterium]